MINIQDTRFIVSYTKNGKRISYSKQFNSIFHRNHFITKMVSEGYGDVTVEEKKNTLGTFLLTFKQKGEDKSITKNFITAKAKKTYIDALKRNGCSGIKAVLLEKKIIHGGNSVKFIPAKEDDVTHYYSRTNKKSYYKEK